MSCERRINEVVYYRRQSTLKGEQKAWQMPCNDGGGRERERARERERGGAREREREREREGVGGNLHQLFNCAFIVFSSASATPASAACRGTFVTRASPLGAEMSMINQTSC